MQKTSNDGGERRFGGATKGAARIVFGGSVLVAALAAATVPAQAAVDTQDPVGVVAPAATMAQALERDLGLTPRAAQQRLAQEATAASTEQALRNELGASYAGSYFSGGAGTLTVAVTDPATVDEVRAAGATPAVVARSENQLTAAQRRLDAAVRPGSGVTSSYVDPATNAVVLTVAPGSVESATAQVAASGVDAAGVRVVESVEAPRALASYRGGDPYYINNQFVCSVGFAVRTSGGTPGFVTAGHCGETGDTVTNSSNQASGSFRGSSFPGNDYAWVGTNGSFTGTGVVTGAGGASVAVKGSTVAAVGSSVCRSGQTTGWNCGTIQSRNQSVYYAEGTVSGLTRTTACAEGGDSGGAWMSGNQAQGVTSGGSGSCTTGGTTYFQPVREILSAYGLSLLTS